MNFANNWNIFTDFMKSQQAADSARAAGEPPAAPVPEFLRDVAPAPAAPAPGSMTRTLRTVPALGSLDIPERQPVLGDWFMEGDLGFIYAPRGLGKTWFALGMATAITNGTAFGPWQAAARRRILYVDGEMPCQALRARVSGMGAGEDFVVLNHEAYFHLEAVC